MELTLGLLLFASINLNLYLYFKKQSKGHKETTYDCTALMRDLTNGKGLVEIRRIDPADVFLRSPRTH